MGIKNKRGVFFTILVIVMFTLFLITYSISNQSYERKTTQKRVETLNSFVNALEEDLPRQLYISGFRIIFVLEKEVIESGEFIPDVDSATQELFTNGSLNGIAQQEMLGSTLSEIESTLRQRANKLNLDLSLSNSTLVITQSDPWNVEMKLTTNLYINDQGNQAYWEKTETYSGFVPTEKFEDPIYTLNTNGLVFNKVEKTPHTNFVVGGDASNLLNHTLSSYYIASSSAPSFLDRLEGKTSSNALGVESLVNLQQLSSQGIPIKDKTVVDYLYFSSNDPSKCKTDASGMPSWFKLDNQDGHLATYNVSCI